MTHPKDITGNMHNRVVVTLIAAGDGNVALVADGKQQTFRSVDRAVERAREILDTHPDERAAFDSEMASTGEDEHSQGAAR